ncbi:MAG: dTDP-4-dehydrorhamnose 3,5-epimerase family protein [Candidatus Kerfeldbacteria bacterium]|nr:dTDP-4-dehydrorhamnose 3,5-epimerase family protein [Candidatus Kerfeldbacteria bacterium]
MKKLTEKELTETANADLTKQDYSAREKVVGVVVSESKRFIDDGGEFVEIVRAEAKGALQGFAGFVPAQFSWSVLEKGRVKGVHLHMNQEDVWFVPPSSTLLIGLKDCRKDSKTHDVVQRLVLGAGRAHLLYIPRGVAHGYKALSEHSELFYFVNRHFSPDVKKSDEYRLPIDSFGQGFWDYTPS